MGSKISGLFIIIIIIIIIIIYLEKLEVPKNILNPTVRGYKIHLL